MSYRNYTPTRITKYHLTLCSIVVVHSSIHDLHNDKDQKLTKKAQMSFLLSWLTVHSWVFQCCNCICLVVQHLLNASPTIYKIPPSRNPESLKNVSITYHPHSIDFNILLFSNHFIVPNIFVSLLDTTAYCRIRLYKEDEYR